MPEKAPYKDIGNRLRDYALHEYGSVSELERKLGKKRNHLSQYISGRSKPGRALQVALEKLGINIDWLISSEDKISSPLSESIQTKMRGARGAKGYTQEQIAKLLGIAKNTYINYEKGFTRIPAAYLQKFNQLCNVTLGAPETSGTKEMVITITIKITDGKIIADRELSNDS